MANGDSTRRFTDVTVMLRVNGSARRLRLDNAEAGVAEFPDDALIADDAIAVS